MRAVQGGRRKRHQRRRYFTRSDRLKGARYEELALLAIRQSFLPRFLFLLFFSPPLPYFFDHLIRVVRDSRNASLSRFHHNFVNLTMSSTNEERRETRGEAWHTRVARNFTKVAAREHPRLAHVEQLVSPAFGAS